MFDLIIKLSEVLNLIKNFCTGYTSSVKDKIIIEYKDKRYVAEFREIDNKEDIFKSLDKIKYL